MKPIIGIIEWPYHDLDNDSIYEILTPIIEWVNRSGGRPIGIFPTQVDGFLYKRFVDMKQMSELEQQELKETVQMCDAIIKPGALKIYPHERLIYDYCLEEGIPYLGICAGMQLMASYGKDMVKNVKNETEIIHHSKEDYIHSVKICDDTLLKNILNKDEIMVNSRHNYHIENSGIQIPCAYADDGVIEAIESSKNLFHLGVQWHPELLPREDENSEIIFGELVEAAKTYQKRKK